MTNEIDATLLGLVFALRHDQLTPVVLQISALGNGLTVGTIALAAATLLFVMHRARAALFLLVSTGGAILLHVVAKPVLGRARPDEAEWLARATAFSFPSGHAVNASATYLALALVVLAAGRTRHLARIASAVLLVVALLVCVSRPYLGVHYPMDVFAGFALGTAWTMMCARSLLTGGVSRQG